MSKTGVWMVLALLHCAGGSGAWAEPEAGPMGGNDTDEHVRRTAQTCRRCRRERSQVCVTQAMIDKYGGPYSNPPTRNAR